MKCLDLFSGIGGIALGLEAAGMETVGFCERESACRHWLSQHWPHTPIYDDIKTLTGAIVKMDCGPVDIIAGGFPCQPFSVAGKQKGTEDERHLWPEMSRIIREVRPRWVLAENVPGLRTIAADLVLEDLEGQGYTCWPLVVGADDVGAPHRRKRVWIVARKRLADADEQRERDADELRRIEWASRAGASDAGRGSEGMDHAASRRCGSDWSAAEQFGPDAPVSGIAWPSRPGEPQHPWEAPRLAHTDSARRKKAGSGSSLDAGREFEPGRGEDGMGDPNRSRGIKPQDEADSRARTRRGLDAAFGAGAHGGGMADSTIKPPRSPGQPRQDPNPRESESQMGGSVDGISGGLAGLSSSHRREALKALGNSVVPPLVTVIGRAIMKLDREFR